MSAGRSCPGQTTLISLGIGRLGGADLCPTARSRTGKNVPSRTVEIRGHPARSMLRNIRARLLRHGVRWMAGNLTDY